MRALRNLFLHENPMIAAATDVTPTVNSRVAVPIPEPKSPDPSAPESDAEGEDAVAALKSGLASGVEAADAQLSIWMYRVLQIAGLALLAVPILLTLFALFIYGFILLDNAFYVALVSAELPAWAPSLIRGGIYFLVAGSVLFASWKSVVPASDDPDGESTHVS